MPSAICVKQRATDRADARVANVGAGADKSVGSHLPPPGAHDLQSGAFAPAVQRSTTQQPAQQPPEASLAACYYGTGS